MLRYLKHQLYWSSEYDSDPNMRVFMWNESKKYFWVKAMKPVLWDGILFRETHFSSLRFGIQENGHSERLKYPKIFIAVISDFNYMT